MLSSSPASCTSPNPDKDNPSKKVQWASGRRRTSSTDSESKSHPDPPSRVSRSRRPSRLTVKYDRGQLQRWLETEQWVDAKVQELFQVGSMGAGGRTQGPRREPACRPQGEREGWWELLPGRQSSAQQVTMGSQSRNLPAFGQASTSNFLHNLGQVFVYL